MSRTLLRALKSARLSWRKSAGVQAVGVGQKVTNKKATSEISVVFYVVKKEVKPRKSIPKTLTVKSTSGKRIRIKTDVQAIGRKFKLCSYASGSKILTGTASTPKFPGTASLVWERKNEKHLLTCAHLFFNPDNPDNIPWCLSPNFQRIGQIDSWTTPSISSVNLGDAAHVVLNSDVEIVSGGVLRQNGQVTRISHFDFQTNDYFYVVRGKRFDCEAPTRLAQDEVITAVHRGASMRFGNCWLLRMTSDSVESGHSGALIVRRAGADLEAAGILFGTSNGTHALAYDADAMLQRLGVDF
jgi:hypothetical protein